jgi:protein-S-isoprenylcysteine O-methyltransferase Ste14
MSMQTKAKFPKPLFELRGRASFIDLSAYVSGVSYAAGLIIAGPARIRSEIISGGPALYVLLASFAAFIAAVLLIQRHMGFSLTVNTFGKPRHFVTDGIFRYSRNPVYVAFLLPLASLAVLSVTAAVAAIGLYVLAMNVTVIRTEERDLAERFGEEFAAYVAKVPRWLF